MMPSRRSLPKSHHGCLECKRRKVKCDERRPVCSNCSTRSRDCVFEDLPIVPFHGPSQAPSPSPPESSRRPSLQPPTRRPTPLSTPNSALTPTSSLSLTSPLTPDLSQWSDLPAWNLATMLREPLNATIYEPSPLVHVPAPTITNVPGASVQDMELMHHFTTHTHLGFSYNHELDNLWRDTVPRLAFDNLYLLHGVLALSALHLAQINPTRREHYRTTAAQHYTSSLELFRPVLQVKISQDNCHAVFAFGIVAAFIAMAMPEYSMTAQASNFDALHHLLEVMGLFRGIPALLADSLAWVRSGPMGPFMRPPGDARDPGIFVPAPVETAIRALEARNEALNADGAYDEDPDAESGASADEHCSREDYANVITALRPAFSHIHKGQDKMLMIAWLVMVPTRYINAFRQREPLALVVMAHYAVAFHAIRDNWFVNDMGKRVVEAVDKVLGEEWNGLMAWPKAEVGLS